MSCKNDVAHSREILDRIRRTGLYRESAIRTTLRSTDALVTHAEQTCKSVIWYTKPYH